MSGNTATHDGTSSGTSNVDVGSINTVNEFTATWYSSRPAS